MSDGTVDLPQLFAIYRPFNHLEFVENLRKLEFHQPKWLYAPANRAQPMQGDIFPELEIAWVNADGGVEMYLGPAMLIGNSCDAVPDQDEVVSVAPVLTVEDFRARRADEPDLKSMEADLRNNRLTSGMFLPAVRSMPESYVEFAYACPVATARVVSRFAEQQEGIIRLSEKGWWLLTGKLAHHLSRGSRE